MSVVATVERKINGVNRTVLAKELGMDRSYVSRVLGGKKEPGLGAARKVAKRLGVRLEDFASYLESKSTMEAVN
jgi:transcriptional regulator with XRE-family HTH domain